MTVINNSALEFCRYAEKEIREKMPTAIFHHEIREGDAREEILDVASKWFADTILIGEWNHEYSRCPSMGSVSRAIATHAPCSVEIVREKQAVTTT